MGAASRKLNLTRIEIAKLIEECMTRARNLHGLPEGSLEFHPGPPVTILADADEVGAAVSNLLDNAVKYSGSKVKVTVETEKLDQKFVIGAGERRGLRHPQNRTQPRLQAFPPRPRPARVARQGHGLGLYIVRSVAKRHGGRAWAHSEGPGKGSVFVLQLPIAR